MGQEAKAEPIKSRSQGREADPHEESWPQRLTAIDDYNMTKPWRSMGEQRRAVPHFDIVFPLHCFNYC